MFGISREILKKQSWANVPKTNVTRTNANRMMSELVPKLIFKVWSIPADIFHYTEIGTNVVRPNVARTNVLTDQPSKFELVVKTPHIA